MEKLHALFLAATVSFVLLILDGAFKQQLHDSSAALTELIQTTSSGVMDCFFKFIDVASLGVVVLVPVYGLATEGVKRGFPLLAATCVAAGISDVLKMTYADERPYWAYSDVKAIGCTTGFGHPSGHSLLAGSAYGLFAYYAYKQSRKALAWTFLAGVVLVGYDRIYLGVHSYNQVLVAWGLSAIIVYTVLLLKISKETNVTRTAVGSHCFAALCLGLGALLRAYYEPYWDSTWTDNILEVTNLRRNV